MARHSNNEPLIPIDLIAAKFGFLPDVVWRQLKDSDVVRDWDYSYCVRWDKARELYDPFEAAREANDRLNRENAARQEAELQAELER